MNGKIKRLQEGTNEEVFECKGEKKTLMDKILSRKAN
jgi:hypothetical protein